MKKTPLYAYVLLWTVLWLIAGLFWNSVGVMVCLINVLLWVILLIIREKNKNYEAIISDTWGVLSHIIGWFMRHGGFFVLYFVILRSVANRIYFWTHILQVIIFVVLFIVSIGLFELDKHYNNLTIGYIHVQKEFFWIFPGLVWGVRYLLHFGAMTSQGGFFVAIVWVLWLCLFGGIIGNVSFKKIINSLSVLLISLWFVLWGVYVFVGSRWTSWEKSWTETIKTVDRVVYLPLSGAEIICSDDWWICPASTCKTLDNLCVVTPEFAECDEMTEQWWSCLDWYDQVVERCIFIQETE